MASDHKPTHDVLRRVMSDFVQVHQRPCMLFAVDFIDHDVLLTVRSLIKNCEGDELDLFIESPGGYPEVAYLIVRELRRRFKTITAYVPFQAKSAATLLCLGAHTLVVGDLGELGPLDVQLEEKQEADLPLYRSCLERFKALEQLQRFSVETFNFMVQIGLMNRLRTKDAWELAINFTGQICGPLFSQIDPERLGQSARGLEVGEQYARRILRRYRPQLLEDETQLSNLLRKLVRGYPSHGFIIDREELEDIGIPVRAPAGKEAVTFEFLEGIFGALAEPQQLIDLFPVKAADSQGLAEDQGSDSQVTKDEQPPQARQIKKVK